MELALKGALKVLGVDYPRIHDVAPVFSEQQMYLPSIQSQSPGLQCEKGRECSCPRPFYFSFMELPALVSGLSALLRIVLVTFRRHVLQSFD